MTEIKTKILESLQKSNIRMIPKWKFVLYSVIALMGMLFIFLITVFVLSLILFVLSRYGFMYMPFFGFAASLHMFSAIPALLLICTGLLLVMIEVISRTSSFSFRKPLAVTLLSLTVFALAVSFVINETPMHEYVREYAQGHHMGMMARVYDRPVPFNRADGIDVVRGEVVATSSLAVTVQLFDGGTIVAYTSSSTDMGTLPLIGDDVVIFGNFIDKRFVMHGIRHAPSRYFGKHMNTRGTHMQFRGNMMK